MKCLIDTHTLLWIVTGDQKLSDRARDIYLNTENLIFFSMAGLWEMAIKISLNKLFLEGPLKDFIHTHIKGNDIKILNIEVKHILSLENLPFYHRDPFDRLLISQSMNENIPILSSDKAFDLYPVKRIW